MIFFIAWVLIVFLIIKSLKQFNSKYHKPVKVTGLKVLSIAFIISSLIFLVSLKVAYDYKSSISAKSGNFTAQADGYTIENYTVTLDVGLDNKVDVTEEIGINFYEAGHHGIYKYTPYWLEYTGKDGKTISRKSDILNLQAVNDEYTIDTVNGKERIKIGSKSITVFGDHTYVIKYTYDMGSDPYEGFDEFIFHAFGDYWGTEIKNPKLIVNMPKGIDGNVISIYRDKYRQEKINNLVDCQIAGNKLTITGKGNITLLSSLTVDIELPDNYFISGSFNYGWKSLVTSIIIIGITGVTIFAWIKHGKNYEKRIPTIEFYAPDNLNSAEIGYIYNHRNPIPKLTISLIIELASKGYVKIDEEKDGKKSKIKITNLLITPKAVNKDKYKIPNRSIIVRKIRDYDDTLDKSEITMMKYLFKKDNEKKIEANIDEFLKVKDKLVNGSFIEIIHDNIDEINNSSQDKEYAEAIKNYNKEVEIYNKKVESLPKLSKLEYDIYNRLFETNDSVILSEHTTFYQSFNDVNDELEEKFKEKVVDTKASKIKWITFDLAVLVLDLSLLSFFKYEDLYPKLSPLYYISFLCIFVIIFFSFIMGRKTEYGEIISARVKGFRDFLETAEKEQLEAMVEKNPHYFYDILPYTYVLNVSKKWIEKFQDIKMPEVDLGNIDYSSGDRIFSDMSDNVYIPVYTGSGRSSGCSSCSSCSSCGGGCSSCGGGCSSCGGGGSW